MLRLNLFSYAAKCSTDLSFLIAAGKGASTPPLHCSFEPDSGMPSVELHQERPPSRPVFLRQPHISLTGQIVWNMGLGDGLDIVAISAVVGGSMSLSRKVLA